LHIIKQLISDRSWYASIVNNIFNSILADHFADVGFRKIIGDNRYLGLVKNIVNSKEPHIKSLVDKHRGDGKQSTELFNNIILFYAFFK
jgi:hypothetical protein